MWVSWVMARRLVVGLVLVALALVGPAFTLFLLIALFLDQGLDVHGGAGTVGGQLLRILLLAFALWVAIETLDLRGPDPDVPRHVFEASTQHELRP